ncbi:MAG: hypothetical protein RL038_1128 [Actinomycetota bacterium]|jgi:hypothetical protein
MDFEQVNRPVRKTEYRIYFSNSKCKKEWENLNATRIGDLITAWDFLTKNPTEVSPVCYRLKGELGYVIRNGKKFDRWQLKISITHGARIWYWIENNSVFIEQVHTSHPNKTK